MNGDPNFNSMLLAWLALFGGLALLPSGGELVVSGAGKLASVYGVTSEFTAQPLWGSRVTFRARSTSRLATSSGRFPARPILVSELVIVVVTYSIRRRVFSPEINSSYP